MNAATLLVELLTEELPPKALARLGESFADGIIKGLVDGQLVAAGTQHEWFASPRRLAVTIAQVADRAPDRLVAEKIMPVAVALDAGGKPTPALVKKLEAKGIPLDALPSFEKRLDGKSETFFCNMTVPGAVLDAVLAGIVADSIKKLPIPKLMRWGDSDHQFVRPVHGLVMLHGSRMVPGEVLGLVAGNTTRGHRFMGEGVVTIAEADRYAGTLYEKGGVIASFAARRALIAERLKQAAVQVGDGAHPVEDDALLDEVTALVENPAVYVAEFEPEFLSVPQECLILTMKQNQKYFPLFDAHGKLLNRFLIVSNMQLADPSNIVAGNQRVVRPRLSDARFFFEQDRKHGLASRVGKLDSVVYHNRLGSIGDRVRRLTRLATAIAARLGADRQLAEQAARLCKADLVTDMVGEFPELQGTMGRYYALHEGAPQAIADAIEQHYRPRFAGDMLPHGNIASAVALSDKLDALVGFFGIGQTPTGDKDPFGLRRAALGVLRILMEVPLPLDLAELVKDAEDGFDAGVLRHGFVPTLLDFMFERLRNQLREAGHSSAAVDAVLSLRPTRLDWVPAKLTAVHEFVSLAEASALAAANKRIVNILRKAEEKGEAPQGEPDVVLLQEPAERALFQQVNEIAPLIRSLVAAEDYTGALSQLASLRDAVDSFFDSVMVMADEPLTRANRLRLLSQLAGLMNCVADISRLALEK
ncbi:MAG: glycine--tRNA ligase subunit beta [Candidatus Methylophosphatis roskildensis]